MNDRGRCIALEDCPSLKEEARKKWAEGASFADILRTCGFIGKTPYVCCPLAEVDSANPKPSEAGESIYPEDHPNVELLKKHACGKITSDKIFGAIYPGDYTWMALLRIEKDGDPKNLCGGTLVNERYVLTAAHCFDGIPGGRHISVRLGEYDLMTDPDCLNEVCGDPVQMFGIEEVIKYTQYNNEKEPGDIALIRLNGTANITDFVSPICLPTGKLLNKEYVGKNAQGIGWGITGNETKSSVLREMYLRVVNNSQCLHISMPETLMCAKSSGPGDIYFGDQGGGLLHVEVHQHSDPRSYLIGVEPAAQRGRYSNMAVPRLYTRVGPFVNWILDNLKP